MILNKSSGESVCEAHFPQIKLRAGASIVKIKPLFTFDSKYVLVCSGCHVKIFSLKSGECTHTFKGHKKPVVSLQMNKKNTLQVLSCSEDGVVIRWDCFDGKALKVYNLCIQTPVTTFYAPTAENLWFATTRIEGTDCSRVYALTMKGGKAVSKTLTVKPVHPSENAVAFGVKCSYVAGIYSNELHIYILETKEKRRHKTGERTLTCVACHPFEYILATGDCDGRILVWADMLNSNHPSRSIYHWHVLPLADLIFSTEGSHIYSGGGESVLVKWNLNSGSKQVIPRLGLPICLLALSPDNSYIATAHTDNAIQIISAHNIVVQVFQGLTQGHLQDTRGNYVLPTGILYDPRSNALVMNGKPGHLQFYKIHEDRQLFNLDIVGRNYISQERESVIINTDVVKAAIDQKGLWLATVECRDDGETYPEISLKFWIFNIVSQKFVLNTNIILPHDKKVNCLKFRPQPENPNAVYQPLAVTTSDDGRFKIWALSDDTTNSQTRNWYCESMGYYRKHPAGDCSFSEDGSLLAVAFNHAINLWTPDSGLFLKATLCHSENQNAIQCVLFGCKNCSHLLVSHSDTMLTVWNVLTLSVLWNVKSEIQCLAGDPFTDIMAAFTKDGNVFIFKPSQPNPILTLKNASVTRIVSAIFVPRPSPQLNEKLHTSCCWQQHTQLYFLNEKQELLTVTDEPDKSEETTSEKLTLHQNLPVTPYGLIQAEHSASGVKIEKTKQHITHGVTKEENEKVFDIPCPTNQNPIAMCSTLISSMLIPRQEKKQKKTEEEVISKKETSDSESDIEQSFIPKNESSRLVVDFSMDISEPEYEGVDDYSFLLDFSHGL